MVLWSIKKAINIFLKNGERNKICMVIPLSTFAKRNRISFFCQSHRCIRTFISIWIQTQNVGKHIRLYPSNSLCVIQHILKTRKHVINIVSIAWYMAAQRFPVPFMSVIPIYKMYFPWSTGWNDNDHYDQLFTLIRK